MTRTHCKNGHPWTAENIYLADRASGISEKCRQCRHDATVRFRQRRRAAKNSATTTTAEVV